jgi:Fe-S cluster assembly iron-binding protein IscA
MQSTAFNLPKECTMLNITRAASGYLNDVLDRVNAPVDSAVRIVVVPEGLKTTIDHERNGDQHFDHDGRKVLVLDQEAASELEGRTLDVEGKRLICLS